MSKSLFEDELMAGMEKQLRKQASAEKPSLAKAAECLHAALEIFEGQGMTARADQVLKLLQKIAQSNDARTDVMKMPTPKALMEAGLTDSDMREFAKGSPIAKAKFNLVLRSMGFSDHHIGQIIGPTNVMSEDEAKELIDPNRSYSKIWDFIKNPQEPFGEKLPPRNIDEKVEPGDAFEFKSKTAQKKRSDRHTKGLTSEKMTHNLKDHGHPMNLANDCAVDLPPPVRKGYLKESDIEPAFKDLFDSPSFDIDASDDELFGIEIKEDNLEVSENDLPMGEMHDFEDERD